ncbi:MAG: 2-keto-4-pentenoate hydratase [Proteobacteria bacterium]|nr:2-keto-4-pentenoate hydratase [Pseudomonadota bacterium]
MKLATLKRGGRDGTLIVVSKDLTRAVEVNGIAPTLQQALEHWTDTSPRLQSVYDELNAGKRADAFTLHLPSLASPLPRAYQWLDGSAYVKHVELVRKARGVELPESFWHDPLMYQGLSDGFLAPHEDIPLQDPSWGLDLEAEVAVITDDVPMGITPEEAAGHIKLLMLVNDVTLRGLTKDELAKGFGFIQSKPASAFSPIAVTPDELGDAWSANKVHLPLLSFINAKPFGHPNAGVDMTFDFAQLVAHGAKTRNLSAGTIVGSGTVANITDSGDADVGSSCIAEIRMIETIKNGAAKTPWLQDGDSVKIDMLDKTGSSIFGAIEQKVRKTKGGVKAA